MANVTHNTETTIVHIADALGISPATVSRALNDHPRISDKTKEKVKSKAVELGYRHNKMASGLRNRSSRTVGLIVPRISMYFHAVVITAIQNKLHKKGYNLIICQSNDSYELEVELANALYSSRVDALLVSTTLYTEDFSHFDGFVKQNIPLVIYDRVPLVDYPAQVVKGDDHRGGFLAGNHLLETGCKNIALIAGPVSCNLYKDRVEGFREAMAKAGMKQNEEQSFFHELTVKNARNSLRKLFSRKPYPDGVFACNDITAIAVLEYAREKGLKVPADLKIVGYSNDPRSAIISPPITTIDQHPEEVAEHVVATLMDMLDKKQKQVQHFPEAVITPVSLIRRMST